MPTKARACCASIGNRPAVILRNHGLLALGPHDAAGLRACCGPCSAPATCRWPAPRSGPTITIPDAVQRKCSADALQFDPEHGAGRDVFDAMVRLVDRIDPSYRD